MIMSSNIKNILSLYSTTILSIVVGVGVSILNTRLLGAEAFGDFKFIQTIFHFVTIIIVFGYFNSISRLLTVNEDKEKSFYGVFVLVALALSIIGFVIIFLFSFFNDIYFKNNIGDIIRISAIFIIPILFLTGLQNILKGSQKIGLLSITQVLPQFLYLIIILFLTKLTVLSAISITYSITASIILLIILYLKPSFKNIKERLKTIVKENKVYGKHIYFGSVAALGSGQIGGLAIGYFLDNKELGLFSLAVTISAPLLMVPSIIGTTFFKQFAVKSHISKKILFFTILITVISYVFFNLLLKPVVNLFYTNEFLIVVKYARLIVLGSIFHGFGDLYNRFMGSHGQGKLIRNGAFTVGFVNILGFTFLIYYFGIYGALLTKVVSGVTYFLVMYIGYKNYLKKSKKE